MSKDLVKINNELDVIEAQVKKDFLVIDDFKKEKQRFLKKIHDDKKANKITKLQYSNYKKEANKILQQDLNQLNDNLVKFKTKYEEDLNEYNKEVKARKKKFFKITPKVFAIIALILVPTLMVIGLTLNYLLVAPVDFSDRNSVIGFSISMFIIVADLIFLIFICKNSTKKMMLDRYNNAAKIFPIGFVANFFDVLGIGSFATNTNLLKVTKSIRDDKKLPGTLNTGMAISNLFTGALFVGVVQVEMSTLIPFVIATIIGSLIGSKILNKVNTRIIQLVMGIVLAFTAIIMLLTVRGIQVLPSGTLLGVFGIWWKFIVGLIAFAFLGIFMSFGVGLYAPAMAIISLLGIDFLVVFPIMTVSAGLSMHINGYRYSHDNNYLPKTSFCMTLGGMVGVITSFIFIFVGLGKGLGVSTNDIKAIFQWISVPVIAYASFLLLWGYFKSTKRLKNQLQPKKVIKEIPEIDYNNFNVFVNTWSTNLTKEIIAKR